MAVAKTLLVMFVFGLVVGAIAGAIQNLWFDDVGTYVVLVVAGAGVGLGGLAVGPVERRFRRASHDGASQ